MASDLLTKTDTETDDTSASRRMDPEVRVIGTLIRILDDLDESAKNRVVSYISNRYTQPKVPACAGQ